MGTRHSSRYRARRTAAALTGAVIATGGLTIAADPTGATESDVARSAEHPEVLKLEEGLGNIGYQTAVTLGGRMFFTGWPTTGPSSEVLVLDPATNEVDVLTDVRFGQQGFGAARLTAAGGQLYFIGDDGTSGYELWRADPTTGKTELVKDIAPGADSSAPDHLTVVGDHLYFAARSDGWNLWRVDLATGEASAVAALTRPGGTDPHYLTALGDTLYLQADDGTHGADLWSVAADGVAERHEVTAGDEARSGLYSAAHRDDLYFFAGTTAQDSSMWRLDGTSRAVTQVPGSQGLLPSDIAGYQVAAGGSLFFQTRSALWRVDGAGDLEQLTGPGTNAQPEAYVILPAGPGSSSDLYFLGFEQATGYEWWSADGATGDLDLVADVAPGPAHGLAIGIPAVVGSEVYFPGTTEETGEGELYRSTIGSGEATLVADLTPGPTGSLASPLAVLDGSVFFTTSDGNRTALWRTVAAEEPEEPEVPLTATRPRVTGTPSVGSRLTAVPGEATPAEATPSYRWYRGIKAIARATKRTYRVTRADRGARLSVRVTWTLEGSEPLTTRSKQTRTIR